MSIPLTKIGGGLTLSEEAMNDLIKLEKEKQSALIEALKSLNKD